MFEGVGAIATPADTGAGGGGAGEGTTTVVETPPGTTEGDGGGEGEGAGEGEGGEGDGSGEGEGGEPAEGEEDGSLEDIDADGRKTDAKTRKEIAELKKTNPDAGKKWADDHFHRKAFEAEFPGGVREARQTKAILESVGGEEGLTALQGAKDSYETEIRQFRDGDPALLSQLHEANGDSFVTAMQNGLELLAGKDLKQFDSAILPAMATRLETANVISTSNAVLALIKEGKGQEAFEAMSKVCDWLNGAKNHAKKLLDTKTAKNPEREALDRERADIQKEKAQTYTNTVTEDVNRLNNPILTRVTLQLFKDLKLSDKGRTTFRGELTKRVWAEMAADKPYIRAATALRTTGDKARHARFIHDKFREVLPEQFRQLRNEMYPHMAKRSAAAVTPKPKAAVTPKGGAATVPAPKVVAGKVYPKADVDILRTPQEYIILGKAYLKGTTTVVPYDRG